MSFTLADHFRHQVSFDGGRTWQDVSTVKQWPTGFTVRLLDGNGRQVWMGTVSKGQQECSVCAGTGKIDSFAVKDGSPL